MSIAQKYSQGQVPDGAVIMNAGEELRLRVAAEAPAPPGLVRDFILVLGGWAKDGDFNKGHSRTVLSLPTHADAAYDVLPGRLEDDPVYRRHRRHFQEHHTR